MRFLLELPVVPIFPTVTVTDGAGADAAEADGAAEAAGLDVTAGPVLVVGAGLDVTAGPVGIVGAGPDLLYPSNSSTLRNLSNSLVLFTFILLFALDVLLLPGLEIAGFLPFMLTTEL